MTELGKIKIMERGHLRKISEKEADQLKDLNVIREIAARTLEKYGIGRQSFPFEEAIQEATNFFQNTATPPPAQSGMRARLTDRPGTHRSSYDLKEDLKKEFQDWGSDADALMSQTALFSLPPFEILASFDSDKDVTGLAIGKLGEEKSHTFLVEKGGEHIKVNPLATGGLFEIKIAKNQDGTGLFDHLVLKEKDGHYVLDILLQEGEKSSPPLAIRFEDWTVTSGPRAEAHPNPTDSGTTQYAADQLRAEVHPNPTDSGTTQSSPDQARAEVRAGIKELSTFFQNREAAGVVGDFSGKRPEEGFYSGNVDRYLSNLFFKSFHIFTNILYIFTDILHIFTHVRQILSNSGQTFAEDAKLALKIFENDTPFSLSGVFRAFLGRLRHKRDSVRREGGDVNSFFSNFNFNKNKSTVLSRAVGFDRFSPEPLDGARGDESVEPQGLKEPRRRAIFGPKGPQARGEVRTENQEEKLPFNPTAFRYETFTLDKIVSKTDKSQAFRRDKDGMFLPIKNPRPELRLGNLFKMIEDINSKGTIFMRAEDLGRLLPAQQEELFKTLYMNRSEARLVVYETKENFKTTPVLNSIFKLENVFRTSANADSAYRKFALPKSLSIHLSKAGSKDPRQGLSREALSGIKFFKPLEKETGVIASTLLFAQKGYQTGDGFIEKDGFIIPTRELLAAIEHQYLSQLVFAIAA